MWLPPGPQELGWGPGASWLPAPPVLMAEDVPGGPGARKLPVRRSSPREGDCLSTPSTGLG